MSAQCRCGEWRLTPDEIEWGWHVVATHDPGCDGTCKAGRCPVMASCGPVTTTSTPSNDGDPR